MSAVDHVTVLQAVDGSILTKRIRQGLDGECLIAAYDSGFWFAVEEVQVNGLLDLGTMLGRLERDPKRCIIRGRPLPDINRKRCRRLLYPLIDDDGQEIDPTFEAVSRHWLAFDFDDLGAPNWNADDLVHRRAAIGRDQAGHHVRTAWPDDPAELVELDLAGDADPAPVDPVKDWPLGVRAAVWTLPPEFGDASAWWQMTSSAGIKPGIRLRLWYWLDHAVDDQACKRWLADAPVDRSLFSAVQVHYVAAANFADPADDPVPVRSGWWWRHQNVVEVPELPEPEPVDIDHHLAPAWQPLQLEPGRHRDVAQACLARADLTDWERDFCVKVAGLASLTTAQAETLAKIADPLPTRARRYADKAMDAVRTARPGERHPTLMSVAVRLYSLADARLLDHGEVTGQLLAAAEAPLSAAERRQRAMRQGGRASENEQACDWARARAQAAPDPPEGFRS